MKNWRTWAILLALLGLIAGAIGCKSTEEEVIQQLVEVKRGDLTISISGDGNIEVANEARLTFGVAGLIEKIIVEEGGMVKKGDRLAVLDAGPLELAVTQAEVNENQELLGEEKAKVGVAQAELGIAQAELGVAQAQTAVIQAQVGVSQARLALELAKLNLDRMKDVQDAKGKVTDAEYEVKVAQMKLEEANYSGDEYAARYWRDKELEAQLGLVEARKKLADILADPDYADLAADDIVVKQLQVQVAEKSLEQSQQAQKQAEQAQKQAEQALKQAKQALEQALLTQKQAELNVKLARQSLEEAQKQLNRATIAAPFSGVIADVLYEEGDTVGAGSAIFHLINPAAMELKVKVDEIDMPGVEVGQSASINIDALPDLDITGKVTYISPLPKVEAGVVLYAITIGFDVPPSSAVRIGMSASADIIAEKHSNVLLVPNRAIKEDSQGNRLVKVMVDGQVQDRQVVIGISNLQDTEIVEGLKEGDTVVIEKRVKPKTSNGFGLFSQ